MTNFAKAVMVLSWALVHCAMRTGLRPWTQSQSVCPTNISTAGGRNGCQRIALVLQGGGALGAYQAGVYQALHEAGLEPDWVSGVSIGAINAAIIAGNTPEQPA